VASKMSELQDALNRYGQTSIRNYKIIHPFGETVIEGLGDYLGEIGCVFGVPPAGDWQNNGRDYHDAQFSTYWDGTLKVDAISMGVSIRIPHTKDGGAFWLRVVLAFLIEGNALSVQTGDGCWIKGLPVNRTDRFASCLRRDFRLCERHVRQTRRLFFGGAKWKNRISCFVSYRTYGVISRS
jgi:hypothetical protein